MGGGVAGHFACLGYVLYLMFVLLSVLAFPGHPKCSVAIAPPNIL